MRPAEIVIERGTPLAWMGGVFLVIVGALLVVGGASGLAALELSESMRRLPRARKTSFATAMLVCIVLGFVAAAFALMAGRFGYVGTGSGPTGSG